MVRRCLLAVLLLVGSFGLSGADSSLAAAPAELISVEPKTGGPLADEDRYPSVSGDGNIVVFTGVQFSAAAGRLLTQVYVRDRASGATTFVPAPAGDNTTGGVVSRDGCHVAFWGLFTLATWDVYAWDRCTPGATPVEVAPTSLDFRTDPGAESLAISSDGRYVAYAVNSGLSAIVSRVDTSTGLENVATNIIASVSSLDMSDDGAFIAVGGERVIDTTRFPDTIVGWSPPCNVKRVCTTEIISVGSTGKPASGFTTQPSVSADGRYVAFVSDAQDIVGLPAPVQQQLYVRDRVAGVTKLVTETPGQPSPAIFSPEISADGTQVAIEQSSGSESADVWVVRSTSGFFVTSAFDLVSFGVSGASVNAFSPSMSSNGRHVAFASSSNNELSGGSVSGFGTETWMRERPTALAATPTVDFGTVDIGSQSAPQNAVVTNTGVVAVNIATVTPPSAPFAVATNGCAGVLQPGVSCNVTVVFRPTAAGPANSAVTVLGDGLTVSSALVGVGRALPTAGSLAVVPTTADFGSGIVVASLGAKNFVVANPGQTSITISGVALSGSGADQFAVGANGCTGSLAGGASCTITVSATVTRVGAFVATLNISGSGGQSAQVTLQARGTARGSVAPTPTTTTTTQPPPPGVFSPVLKMNPGVVVPGGSTVAIGSEFPPNIDVELAFAGESPLGTAHTDGAGGFRFTLVAPADGTHLGGRNIVAIDQAQFSGVRAPLLIDLGTLRPSGAGSPATPNGLPTLLVRGG